MNVYRPKANAVAVIVHADAIVPDQGAAHELAATLTKMLGFPVPVRRCKGGRACTLTAGMNFLVGDGAAAAITGRKPAPLAEDGIELQRVAPDKMVLRGGGTRGSSYAVYEFLELQGVRWFTPDETRIPKATTLTLPVRHRQAPSFYYREALWFNPHNRPVFAMHARYNGTLTPIPIEMGGHWKWSPYVHSFYSIVPPEKYRQTHPEYFSFRKGQGRVCGGAQLCLSNPEVIDILTAFTLEKMADPEVRIVDLSQMDCANPCECPACEAFDRRHGGPSASLVRMCNAVAERTSRVYPDKYVGTLAYTYSIRAPRGLKAHPNVTVRLCHMDGCETHTLDGCALNRGFVKLLQGWKHVTRRLHIWDYVTNFQQSLMFHPNFEALAGDSRRFRQLGVGGILLQGFAQNGVSFSQLHAYVMAVVWDVSRDYYVEAREFLKGYYGEAAAPHLWRMIQALQARKPGADFHLSLYTHPHLGTFTTAQLRAATAHLQRAVAAARGNRVHARRLEEVAMWMDFTRMVSAPPIEARDHCLRIHASEPAAPRLYRSVERAMKRLGITSLCEFPQSMNDLPTAWAWSVRDRDLPLTVLENEMMRVAFSPELNGTVCTMLDKASGVDFLCKPDPRILAYPYMTGMIEGIVLDKGFLDFAAGVAVNRGTLGFKEFDAWKLTEAGAGHATMTITFASALRMTRTLLLLQGEAGFRVSTTIENLCRRTVKCFPHWFILLRAGALEDNHFFRRTADGSLAALHNGMPAGANQEQWVNLSGANVPARSWGLFNPVLKVGFTEESNRDIVFLGSNGHLDTQHILTETRLKLTGLKPGAKVVAARTYRMLHRDPGAR